MVAEEGAELAATTGAIFAKCDQIGLCLQEGKGDAWHAGGPAAVLDVPGENPQGQMSKLPDGCGGREATGSPRRWIA